MHIHLLKMFLYSYIFLPNMSKKKTSSLNDTSKIDIDFKFIERYQQLLGDRYEEFMKISLTPLNKAIRINTLKISKKEFLERFSDDFEFKQVPWCDEGFWLNYVKENRYDLGNLVEHALGYFYVQDPASMIPPVVLNPKPGEIVLDMCAAPGSKSTQIAQYMKNKGVLYLNDNMPDRLKALEINVRRMGISNAIITYFQGSHLASLTKNGILFDKILLDAPCSGSGTIRKSYKTLLRYSTNFVKKSSILQKQLIRTAFTMLKPGGTIVYSTCTLEPDENESVISYLLDEFNSAKIEEINLPLNRSDVFKEWNGEKYNEDVEKCLRIYPQDNDTEGFFVARIKKLE